MTEAEFAQHYRERYHITVFTLLRWTKDREISEELAQDSWARAWDKRDQWRGESQFYSWVLAIARNTLIRKRRRERTFVEVTSGTLVTHDTPYHRVLLEQVEQKVLPLLRPSDVALIARSVERGETAFSRKERTRLFRARQTVRLALGMPIAKSFAVQKGFV